MTTGTIRRRGPAAVALGMAAILAISGCGGSGASPDGAGEPELSQTDPDATFAIPDDVFVQLAELPGGRTIPYFSAELNGRYAEQNLTVIPMDGDPSIGDPVLALADEEGPTILIAPAAVALRASAEITPLVEVARIAARSGDRIVVPADSGISSVADLAGRTITVLEGPAGESVRPALVAAGLDPAAVIIEAAPFDAAAVAAHQVEAAHVRVEDEWAQVLEQVDEETGELVDPASFTVIDLSDPAIAMPGDGIWVRADWLSGHEELVVRFLAAVLGEWAACRDDLEMCAVNAYDNGSLLPLQHQRWVVTEMGRLVWPAEPVLGAMMPDDWSAMAARLVAAGVVETVPAVEEGMRTDLLERAIATLEGIDLAGDGFAPTPVAITPGGEDPVAAP